MSSLRWSRISTWLPCRAHTSSNLASHHVAHHLDTASAIPVAKKRSGLTCQSFQSDLLDHLDIVLTWKEWRVRSSCFLRQRRTNELKERFVVQIQDACEAETGRIEARRNDRESRVESRGCAARVGGQPIPVLIRA